MPNIHGSMSVQKTLMAMPRAMLKQSQRTERNNCFHLVLVKHESQTRKGMRFMLTEIK